MKKILIIPIIIVMITFTGCKKENKLSGFWVKCNKSLSNVTECTNLELGTESKFFSFIGDLYTFNDDYTCFYEEINGAFYYKKNCTYEIDDDEITINYNDYNIDGVSFPAYSETLKYKITEDDSTDYQIYTLLLNDAVYDKRINYNWFKENMCDSYSYEVRGYQEAVCNKNN